MEAEKLIVGTKIKIGKKYADDFGFDEGQVIELVEGYFEYENGLYTETQSCPAIWDESQKDFDSIFHLFGNDLEYWYDCEIV
jgi:methionine salvage enolase-phosphatase E1